MSPRPRTRRGRGGRSGPSTTDSTKGDGPRALPRPGLGPVHSAIDLHRAYLGELDDDEGLECAHCGYRGEIDHEAGVDEDDDLQTPYEGALAS